MGMPITWGAVRGTIWVVVVKNHGKWQETPELSGRDIFIIVSWQQYLSKSQFWCFAKCKGSGNTLKLKEALSPVHSWRSLYSEGRTAGLPEFLREAVSPAQALRPAG